MNQSLMLPKVRSQPPLSPASLRCHAAAPRRGRIGWAPARRMPQSPWALRAQARGEAPLFERMGEHMQRTATEVGTPAAHAWAGRMRSAVARYLHAEKALARSLTRQEPHEPARRRAVLETLRVMENMCDVRGHRVPAALVAALQRDGHWEALHEAMRLRRAEVVRPGQFTAPELQPPRTHSPLVDALRAHAEELRTQAESLVLREWCSTVCQRIVTYIEREAAYAEDARQPGNLALLRAAAAELSFVLVCPQNSRAQELLGWEDLMKDADLMALIRATRCAIDARRWELRPEWNEEAA